MGIARSMGPNDVLLILDGDDTLYQPQAEIRIGDFLLVLPGGRIPTDGMLVAREVTSNIKAVDNNDGCALCKLED